MKLLTNCSQIVTVDTSGKNFKRRNELQDIGVLTDYAILVEGKFIKDLVPISSLKNLSEYEIIDLKGHVILPGLVECHTHTAFSGSRANEFQLRLKGMSYEEIAMNGGGIKSTVSAVRKSSKEELVKLMIPRINNFIAQGVTTIEIKSGYGLDFQNEIKLLEAIEELKSKFKIDIISTFLGAHTFPVELKDDHQAYIKIITEEMIPVIAERNLAVFCDGFCEQSAFSPEELDIVFKKAKESGLHIRLHTEQFNSIGGLELAINNQAISVDHLEVLSDSQMPLFSNSNIVAVLLPGVSYFLDYQYAPARKLIESNAIIALATDFNPGSSHILNISLIMSLAAIKMKMSFEEIISAYTINAAKALQINDTVGSIEIGKNADFAVFKTTDYADIIYNTPNNLNVMTIKNGKIIYDNRTS